MAEENKHYTLLNQINELIVEFGIDIAGPSVNRLSALNEDGSNYYETTIEQERSICERELAAEAASESQVDHLKTIISGLVESYELLINESPLIGNQIAIDVIKGCFITEIPRAKKAL